MVSLNAIDSDELDGVGVVVEKALAVNLMYHEGLFQGGKFEFIGFYNNNHQVSLKQRKQELFMRKN